MDNSFLIENTRIHFEKYLANIKNDTTKHVTLIFFDINLPHYLIEGVKQIKGTEVHFIDLKSIESQKQEILKFYNPQKNYVSIFDYSYETFFPIEETALSLISNGKGMDYTSFEFPRYNINEFQIDFLVKKQILSDPEKELQYADLFFNLLGNNSNYQIQLFSGNNSEYCLNVPGPNPWMEVCGPLCEGNVRFSPGCELFRDGHNVNGEFLCSEGINLLPFRSNNLAIQTCDQFLRLGRNLVYDPILIELQNSQITSINSKKDSAKILKDIIRLNYEFSWCVEIGLGLCPSAAPIENNWGATSNESIPGFHIGFGADPGDTSRFATPIHVDFMITKGTVLIDEKPFYKNFNF